MSIITWALRNIRIIAIIIGIVLVIFVAWLVQFSGMVL